jgi:hypothetical protein
MKKYAKGVMTSILMALVFSASAADRPYINLLQQLEFGELMGFTGSCSLDYDTKIVSDNGGSLCPFSNVRYGEPGRYQIVANFNTDVEIVIASRASDGDGILYTPTGIYKVHGVDDIAISANTNQTISSGTTGVITIILGGTLSLTSNKALGSTYTVDIEQGIIFNEVP